MRIALGTLLIAIAALATLVPLTAAQDGTGGSHHASICTFYPEMQEDNSIVWTLSDRYDGHGGRQEFSLNRGIEIGTPLFVNHNHVETEHLMRTNADTPATEVRYDASWKLRIGMNVWWEPEAGAAPEPTDVVLNVRASIALGHARLDEQQTSVVARSGILGADGADPLAAAPSPNGASSQPARAYASFDFSPVQHEGTIDELSTQLTFSLGTAEPAGSAGTVHVTLDLADFAPGGLRTLGSLLQVGGSCSAHTHGDQSSSGGDPAHGHKAAGSCHDTDHSCMDAPTRPPCVEIAADCAKASDEGLTAQGKDIDPAVSSTAQPLSWGPGAVMATSGVAGLTFFRPRRP